MSSSAYARINTSDLKDGAVTLAELNASTYASQAEAEAGTNQTKLMTPQRVSQAVAVLAPAVQNSSETAAGRVELATLTEQGTQATTGGSGANLVMQAKNTVKARSTYTPAYLTGANTAESNPLIWDSITNGSFRITIDGTQRDVTGLNFSGIVTMNDVATVIQTGLRAVTGSTETVVWSTNHFVITSANTTSISAITETSSTGSGTDISGVTTAISNFMRANAGQGTVTVKVLNPAADENKVPVLNSSGKLNDEFQNITAAQAATLTGGPTSDAAALHSHPNLFTTMTAGEAITVSSNPVPVYMASGEDKYDLRASYDVQNGSYNVTSVNWMGQTFTADCDTITAIQIMVARSTAGANLTMNVYATSGGLPTGAALGTASITFSNFQNAPACAVFNFSPITGLTPGATYAFTLQYMEGGGLIWAVYYHNAGAYANGNTIYSSNSGATWAAQPAHDMIFRVYGTYRGTTGRFYRASNTYAAKTVPIGFITTSAVAAQAQTVYTSGVLGGFTGLTVGAKYYLSADGAITATKPTDPATLNYIVEIGTAVSATQLAIRIVPLRKTFNCTSGAMFYNFNATSPANSSPILSLPVPFSGELSVTNATAGGGVANSYVGTTANNTTDTLTQCTISAGSASSTMNGSIDAGKYFTMYKTDGNNYTTLYRYTCIPH